MAITAGRRGCDIRNRHARREGPFVATIAGVSSTSNSIDPAFANAVHDALAAYLAARGDLRDVRIIELPAALGSGFDSFIYTFRLGGNVSEFVNPIVETELKRHRKL